MTAPTSRRRAGDARSAADPQMRAGDAPILTRWHPHRHPQVATKSTTAHNIPSTTATTREPGPAAPACQRPFLSPPYAAAARSTDVQGANERKWQQRPLAVSRIMQVWRDEAVRERLLRDAASEPYLQRKHFVVTTTGFAGKGKAKVDKARQESIFEKLKDDRELS